ncbi:uncharacterized protein NECHADRAFT_55344 [Fusarium vanettenii 77-13-4]|uniref:Integrase core domain-containing protein n=1 Tax=Fusarium vanettenii (strain ATCC MYA-4622 / CBS 123669 / FGSC 9596 / NRRL 45880 / 77-13-4) TaxID=660122 RepID=C7ZBZ6_FUSV7|nr:uncharacterized protein NECHADRAFT_55344 [Fusarium vanettenii 77-13-4]EEU38450.1 hypothetical protein NECHADRAFT_55344 [Fusarium vanettenii 77-13-4]
MARPPNPIDHYRDYVTYLYLNGVSRSRIQYKLRKQYHVAVNLSTISRRIASWGLLRQQARTKETPELIEATRDLIFRVGLTEKQTLSVLQRQGWPITKRGLKRIRLHPDRRWVRRINSDEERLALLEKTEQVIIEMTRRSNAISGYGKSLLQPYLRQKKQLWWCIDGHDKLKAYGFEIYAAIDAYSRNIIWFYVGHTATTALSVLKQYLAVCDAYGFRPWYLQVDRGSEMPLVAAAHWNFVLATDGRQGKRLKDSYKAALSTKNVKIESWWERMLHVSSRQWVDYFGELARDGDFDSDMLEDQIAIYAVFEDVLRQELFDFVEAWNLHRIRLQKNRPHVIHGQPWMNYHYPDPDKACNWGIPIDRSVLGEMERPLADIDISTCLEPEIKNWCR